MTSGRRALTALHLLLVWAMMAAAVPVLGFGVVMAAWGGGEGATAPVLLLGVPLAVVLLATTATPARTVVPLCGSVPQRLGWAASVFVLGTLGVLAGLAAYDGGVDLGGARTRIALTGVPYAVAAAFFVPNRWVRLGAVTVLAAGVVYGGFVGPAQAQQRQREAEVVRYREHAEVLYLGATPPGMQVSRAEAGPASFSVEYRGVREDVFSYAALTVRSPLTPAPRCPGHREKGVTCTVDARGEMRMVRALPSGEYAVTLVRRHRKAEVEVTSQTLGEAGLRRLLNTLHPLSDEELEELLREEKIYRSS
ncbi:hypothetical protein ACIP6X_33620 [Streptomyces coeruleorubidus]|uniref:hypothetical protein n=1 Tax=Streptomyces coeruleorubidus TaxID=116188 RepID=UPI003816A8BB